MKRKDLPTITPPDPDQIMMAGVAPVSMGERLGWLAEHVQAADHRVMVDAAVFVAHD